MTRITRMILVLVKSALSVPDTRFSRVSGSTLINTLCPQSKYNTILREPVSWDWPLVYLERLARCPGMEDRQGTADLAALETPEGVASLPAPLHFWAEETERNARWRHLRPGTLAGLANWSPEGTEERRAPCNAVYTALPQRGLPSYVLGCSIRTALEASYWKRRSSDPRHLLGRLKNQSLLRQDPTRHAWQGLPHRQMTY